MWVLQLAAQLEKKEALLHKSVALVLTDSCGLILL
jgi:hypothetical protein